MLRRVNDLKDLSIAASDGDIGGLEDIYFDDVSWTVRYLVVDTGTWLPGRKVLISPMSVRAANWGRESLPVSLTKAQVEQSPSIETDLPVNRQYEVEYSRYYGYPYYWTGPYRWGNTRYPEEVLASGGQPVEPIPGAVGDPRLRSARDVMGYYIEASDGDIGHVEDFLIDDREWAIRFMIVDTRNWLPGKKVLVSPDWISRVSWRDSRVYVDLTKQGVESAPEYDPTGPLARDYESRLFGHYGRRSYWE
jgi:sporulation protein YlmC with PRC-barrel domain